MKHIKIVITEPANTPPSKVHVKITETVPVKGGK